MSRGFVKEGDQEEVPMVLPRAFIPDGVPNYVTSEGLKLLHDEMETLKKEWIEAGSNHVTKNHVDAKMRLLSERIGNAVLIDTSKANSNIVSFGMYVKYNDKVIRIVGVDEADASKGLISFISPLAKALIGKKKGDKFEFKVPKGSEMVVVQEISKTMNDELKTLGQKQSTDKIISGTLSDMTSTEKLTNEKTEDRQPSDIKAVNTTTSVLDNISVDDISHDNDSEVSTLIKTEDSESEVQHKRIFTPEDKATDFLPIINEQGNIIGHALYCEIHNCNKLLHPSVHLIVYNSKKEIAARYWWHVAFGETAEKTLKRKIKEITSENLKLKFKRQYLRDTKSERELVSVFTSVCLGEIMPSPDDKDYEAIFEKD